MGGGGAVGGGRCIKDEYSVAFETRYYVYMCNFRDLNHFKIT